MNKMKRIFVIILCLVVTVSMISTYGVYANSNVNAVSGKYADKGMWFWSGDIKNLTISSDDNEIMNYEENATPWEIYKKDVISAEVITDYLGDYAFAGCTGLKEVYFNRGMKYISEKAFLNCPKDMKFISVEDSDVIKSFAEKNGYKYVTGVSNTIATNKVTKKNLVYKVTETGEVAVVGVSSKEITKITIPKSIKIDEKKYKVTKIGKKAFSNCKKLKKVTIKSKNIRSIGKNAFKKCKKLKNIKVPNSKYKKYSKLIKKSGYKKVITK